MDWYPNVNGIPFVGQLGLLPAGPICVCGGQPFPAEVSTIFLNTAYEKTPLFTYADTMSWTRGTHAFKGGVEARMASSEFAEDIPATTGASIRAVSAASRRWRRFKASPAANIPGLQGTSTTGNNVAMRGCLSLLTGSLARVTQLYWIGSATASGHVGRLARFQLRTRELNQNEYLCLLQRRLESETRPDAEPRSAMGLLRRALVSPTD